MPRLTETLNQRLVGTPYSFPGDADGLQRARIITEKTGEMQSRCTRVARTLDEAGITRGQRTVTDLRIRLVYESNAIEGAGTSLAKTDELVRDRALADYTVRASLNDEPQIQEVLGLNAAHLVGERLVAMGAEPIREIDIRELHRFILGVDSPHGGRYKTMNNEIAGSPLRTAHFGDVGAEMRSLVEWLNDTKTSPPLAACLVHAWLTHIHPFLDGNGRMARLMANMILSRYEWPPLVVKSSVDRGEYLDALKHSDAGGDILPLFALFVKVIDRSLTELEDPDFMGRLLRRDIESEQRPWSNPTFADWTAAEKRMRAALIHHFNERGMSFNIVGSLYATDYDYLARSDPAGNGWYAMITAADVDMLVWIGYRSESGKEVMPECKVPAFFFSERDEDPVALHPYRPLRDSGTLNIDEFPLLPGDSLLIAVRSGQDSMILTPDMAAMKIAHSIQEFAR